MAWDHAGDTHRQIRAMRRRRMRPPVWRSHCSGWCYRGDVLDLPWLSHDYLKRAAFSLFLGSKRRSIGHPCLTLAISNPVGIPSLAAAAPRLMRPHGVSMNAVTLRL